MAVPRFSCPCKGENANCMHCDGSGVTDHLIGRRGDAAHGDARPTATPYLSPLEISFSDRVSRILPLLAQQYQACQVNNFRPYCEVLQKLVLEHEHRLSYFYPTYKRLARGELEPFVTAAQALAKSPSRGLRIIQREGAKLWAAAQVARAERMRPQPPAPPTLTFNFQPVVAPQPNKPHAKEASQSLQLCAICGHRVPNIDKHAKRRHPDGQLHAPIAAKKPRDAKKRASAPASVAPPPAASLREVCMVCGISTADLGEHMRRLHARPAAAAGGAVNVPGAGPAKPPGGWRAAQPVSGSSLPLDDIADQEERRLDGKRTWGGRYRDRDGTFGSYPVHDDMGDESFS